MGDGYFADLNVLAPILNCNCGLGDGPRINPNVFNTNVKLFLSWLMQNEHREHFQWSWVIFRRKGAPEKTPLMNPFELRGPNKEIYRCEVKPTPATPATPAGSTILLINERTHDKWSCCVTPNNIDAFRSKKTQDLRLGGMHLVVLAILQEVLRGSLGPLMSSYVPTQDWCTLSLKQKHSRYFMKLSLDCQIGGKRGSWCFPMNPEDPGAIQKRELPVGAAAP